MVKSKVYIGYIRHSLPAGCCCSSCCAIMGWDGPHDAVSIYKREQGEFQPTKIAEYDLTEEEITLEEVLDKYSITKNDTYNKIMTPDMDWII